MSDDPAAPASASPTIRLVQRVIGIQDDERGRVGWSCGYFFFILAAYFVIRPLREEMGVAGGVRNLPWLFTGTLVSMLLIHPPFGAMVARLPRRRFVALTYRFFTVNLLLFFALRHALAPDHQVWLGRVFFVWTSVFNLFVVSVFWGFMADVFTTPQGKRLFGFIGLGGSLGGLLGSTLTAELAPSLGLSNLLLVSALLLETGALCARRLSRASALAAGGGAPGQPAAEEAVIGGSALAGVSHVLRSPYLLGICAYMLLFTIGSTVLYFQQAEFASAIPDPAQRTAFFARLEQAVQILTLVTQAFLTGRILRWLGVVGTLTLLPALSVVGFVALGTAHMLAVFVVFQVLRRAGEFAIAKPTREVLYTVVSREDKYKAKNLIDTFVYRVGDQVGAWSHTLIASVGVGIAGIALLTAPIAGLWLLVAFWLGRRHEAIRAEPGFHPGELPAAS